MQRLFNIPLLFLVIASWLGVFLRWYTLSPVEGVNYTYMLHTHSHVMFLGWVCNVLYLAFVYNHVDAGQHRVFVRLFTVLQVLIAGMLIAFPLQGYGLYSIIFSSLHTLGIVVFAILFFRRSEAKYTVSYWYARMALIFFTLSAAGPFSLGYIMTLGPAYRDWYYFSIYYYLHFQYNGFFTFGIFSLFFKLLESRQATIDNASAIASGRLLAIACIPAYFLSILWAQPGTVFNIVGGIAACMQVYAFVLLLKLFRSSYAAWRGSLAPVSRGAMAIVSACFAVKLLLQCVSALPEIAAMAYQLRPVVIAYLHLVLVGIVTLFLFVWYKENKFLNTKLDIPVFLMCVIAFAGMELVLIAMPWWTIFQTVLVFPSLYYVFAFSMMLAIGFSMVYWKALKRYR